MKIIIASLASVIVKFAQVVHLEYVNNVKQDIVFHILYKKNFHF